MTTATTNVIAKIAAIVAGLGLVAMTFAPAANAQSNDDLQAQIAALLAQIAALQAQIGGSTGGSASVTFTRDLTLGSTGADVTALQTWLISKGHSIPAGATGYFGNQTKAALATYQASVSISPAVGYFGPITRAHVNSMGGGSTGGGDTGGSTGGGVTLNGGEASLGSVDIRDGEEDEVEEGGTAEIAEIEFDVDNGDVRIDRVDLKFVQTGGSPVSEADPWDAFDTITLYDEDGKELASEDVSDEDDWLDEDDGIFRFTGLDYVVREGDTAVIIVEVEAQNKVLDSGDTDTWTLTVASQAIRGVDGEGIQQYTTGSDTITFDLVAEGADDELKIRTSSDDPDAAVLEVETSKRSDWHTVFAFDLEADEDGSDIDLEEITINFTTSATNVSDVINDVELVIDGEDFDDFVWVNPTGTSASTTFDIDGDFTVDSGDRVTVEVMVQFKASSNYTEGDTIQASTTGSLITGEGANDVTATGSATGEVHTLRSEGIDVSVDSKSAVTTVVDGANNDYATFTIVADVTAFAEDAFISRTGTVAYTYQIENASTGAVATTSTATTSVISSSADIDGSSYRVSEGETEEFIFTVTYDPITSDQGQSYRMQLLTIVFGSTAATPTGSTFTASPASNYETNGVLIAD